MFCDKLTPPQKLLASRAQSMCANAYTEILSRLTNELLPQVLQTTHWHRHAPNFRASFEKWCAALTRQDPEALTPEQLAQALAMARQIQIGSHVLTPVWDRENGQINPNIEWSGDGAAAVAIVMRRNLRALVIAKLGDAGLAMLADDLAAEDRMMAQVEALLRRQIGAQL